MHRVVLAYWVGLAAVSSSTAGAQATDPVFLRAQQMVTAGQDSAGRAVVDSVLRLTTEGTPRYAEALFWRATLSRTAAAAERDYRRISVEYPLSSRAPDALLRLSQLEMTRGDRAGARAHLERLQREHPTGPVSTRASVVLARMAFDDGDLAAGCEAVAAAHRGLAADDVELRNQVDYYGSRCANVARDSNSTRVDSGTNTGEAVNAVASPPAAAASTTDTRGTAPESRAADRQEYSVQLAAYDTRASADAFAKRLAARGYAARVTGDRKPFRVRVGRYASRARAAEALQQMNRANLRGVVVEAEPR